MKIKLLFIFSFFLIISILVAPKIAYRILNKTNHTGSYEVSKQGLEISQRILKSDLHTDLLLWDKNILGPSKSGHVDISRLERMNYGLQVFSVVTQTPRGLNINTNDSSSDNVLLLAITQFWPINTWFSNTQRALYQAQRLKNQLRELNGRWKLVENFKEFKNIKAKKALLSIEGMHIDHDYNNVSKLYDAGFRMYGLAHFFDNEIAGSAHGIQKYGLTSLGLQFLKFAQERKLIIDLAHSSQLTIQEVLDKYNGPIVVSHTGIKSTCNNNRNLSDEQIQKIINKKGLIGVGFWDEALCDYSPQGIVKTMTYLKNKGWVDYIGLGSDYEGATHVDFDVTGVDQLIDEMLKAGWSESEISKVMGENVQRWFENLETNF